MATGDPLSLTVRDATLLDPDGGGVGIDGNGWVAELVIQGLATGGAFDASKVTLSVNDPGYDGTGTVTRTRTIRAGAVLRRQYPNDATSLIEASGSDVKITFSLDDDVYAGSTITAVTVAAGAYTGANAGAPATITNSSTLAYPKPLFAWLNPQHERATGTSFAVEAVAYHRHAMLGRQVARVEFIAKDETTGTAATQVVSAPALSSFQTKGNIVEAWKASVPLTALAQGNVCQVNAKVYPWIGDASAVLDLDTDGITWPAARSQTKLRFLNDKSGGYGGGFAYVKAGATGGTVSATAATARAAPFPTIVTALTALAAWNNTNKAHNDHSGGTIRLMDDGAGGAVAHAITNLNGVAAGNCLTDIEVDPLNTAVASAALATSQRTTSMLRWRCNMSCAADAYLEGRNTANYDVHVYDGGTLTFSGGGFAQFGYSQGLQYWRNVTISGLSSGGRSPFQIFTGARNQVALALGIVCTDSTVDVSTDAVVGALIGCDFRRHRIVETDLATHTTADPSDGIVIANNRLRDVRAASIIARVQNYLRGIAFVQNIIERANVDSAEALTFSGDGAVNEIANVVFQHNTFPGTDFTSRINIAYADVAGAAGKRKTIYRRFNIARDWNMKGDLFDAATQGTGRVGNWKPRFAVGAKGDVAVRASDATATPSPTSWLGDYWEPSSAIGTAPTFIDNKAGAALVGGGDYHLTGTTNVAYNRVPTGLQALAYDLDGHARRGNGTGAAGAYESAAVPAFLTAIFAGGEQGALLDLDNLKGLYQADSTDTPVTTPGQAAGYIADRSGRGNNFTQATLGSRPLLQQDSEGFYYLDFDGIDDWMSTAAVNMSASDEVTVVAAVRLESDAATTGTLIESSTNSSSTAGTFAIWSPFGASQTIGFRSRGALSASQTVSRAAAPVQLVVTGRGKISTDSSVVRINGTQVGTSSTDQGTGNFGNQAFYLGRRGGTINPFDGRVYFLLIINRLLTTAELEDAEAYALAKVVPATPSTGGGYPIGLSLSLRLGL